jgi:polysaccharide deacetylase family protein (PEP-CTERM system associated)
MRHALTVDVEDYFHVSAFADTIKPAQWNTLSPRVEANTRKLLELFARRDTRATFFVLGWVAERFPGLVRDIVARGHEVASHGYSHQLVYQQSPEAFRSETAKSKALLEDITGKSVNGYRAASYSITGESVWALDILAELGFEYDSSIFPVYHDRYGMPSAPACIHRAISPSGGELLEFPLTVARIYKWSLPVAGGGYFRLYPYWFSRALLRKSQRDLNQAFIFYLHPWEVDPGQPRVEKASCLSRFRHYQNLDRCEQRLEQLLSDFQFTTVADVLATRQQHNGLPVYDYGSQSSQSS